MAKKLSSPPPAELNSPIKKNVFKQTFKLIFRLATFTFSVQFQIYLPLQMSQMTFLHCLLKIHVHSGSWSYLVLNKSIQLPTTIIPNNSAGMMTVERQHIQLSFFNQQSELLLELMFRISPVFLLLCSWNTPSMQE